MAGPLKPMCAKAILFCDIKICPTLDEQFQRNRVIDFGSLIVHLNLICADDPCTTSPAVTEESLSFLLKCQCRNIPIMDTNTI